MPTTRLTKSSLKLDCFLIGFILLISYFTYVHNYSNPQGFFWDENFYIPNAQKYLTGTFFAHAHPPLGQILIALGEKLVRANAINNQFLNSDYAQHLPTGFSFTGYRLIPVLLAWFTAPLIFGIFLLLTKSHVFAALLSCLYIFDNALIVHLRGAMLEGPLLFFTALTILLFLLLPEWKQRPRCFIYGSILFGICFGLLVTTKPTGFILLLLFPALCLRLLPDWNKCLISISLAAFGFCLIFVAVWQVHFALVYRINPALPNNGYYQISAEYKQILAEKRNGSLLAFPVMLRDSLKYAADYNKNVPRLNLCKPEENGSPAFFWPFGARAINYRWETADGKSYKYLYLQSNPVVWAMGLVGVFLASCLLLASLLLPLREQLQHRLLLATFLVLYVGYMLAVSSINRVMYLYHYFPPLLFSFCLLALSFREIKTIGNWRLNESRKTIILLFLVACIFVSYQFYRPLTYYKPLTDAAFRQRMIFPLWDLRCVKCDRNSPLVVPRQP